MTSNRGNDRKSVDDVQRALIAAAREQARRVRNSGDPDAPVHPGVVSPVGAALHATEADRSALISFHGYEVITELHRGGQGIVYKATQVSTQRLVAIKVMKEGPFAGAVDKARFDREIQILGQLKHSNIVAIHGTGLAAGHHYFVMDYVSGQPLDNYVAGDSPALKDVLHLFVKICDAVNAAHLRGILHRDLKPSNLRIDDRGEPHILDFGLARVAPSESDASFMTSTGQFVGSLPWASPEQAEGVQSRIDLRTDVYSIGVMLYQVLTGRFPYDVFGPMRDVLERITHSDPVRPNLLRRDIDDEVETMVLKCLEKDPGRRYQTAGELGRDLSRYLSGEPIDAKRDSTLYVLRKRLHQRRVPVALGALFLATIVIGLIATTAGWRRAAAERDSAQVSRSQAQAVTDFLIDTLGTANPYATRGANATIGEALGMAATRVASSFQEQPLVQATVYESLAATYDALGLFAAADKNARRALELRRQWLPPEHPDLGTTLCICAQVATKSGEYAQAEAWARESLSLRRKHFGPRHPVVGDSLLSLGLTLSAQGRQEDAEEYLREAYQQATERLGAEHRGSIISGFRLATCLQEQARLSEARLLLDNVVKLARRTFEPDSPEVANMLATLGEILFLEGDREGAESLHTESLAMRRRIFGQEHITIANSLSNLALVYVGDGRFAQAEMFYLESLDMRRRLYGPRRFEVTYALNGLARLYIKIARSIEAEGLLRESLSIIDETLPSHWRCAYAQCLLGAALSNQGKITEAEALFVGGVAGVRAARGDRDFFTLEVLQYASDFHDRVGRPEENAFPETLQRSGG